VNSRISVFVLTIAAILSAGTLDGRAQSLMTRHVRDAVLNGQAQLVGRLPAKQQMQLDIVLPLSNQAGLDAFLSDLRNPASAGGAWKSETAWVDSGGGISPDKIAIPAWQKLAGVIKSSNKGSTTYRNGPDVSANANFTFYVCADQTTCTANEYGGTSFAAPMWAAYVALVNQQLVADGYSRIGFIDPYLYAFGVSSSYGTDFHDVTSGKSGSYSAVTGYDLVTGWGSPNGVNLINALVSEK
jgi:subtilase family serine protease